MFFKFNQDFKKGFYRKFIRIICANSVSDIKKDFDDLKDSIKKDLN